MDVFDLYDSNTLPPLDSDLFDYLLHDTPSPLDYSTPTYSSPSSLYDSPSPPHTPNSSDGASAESTSQPSSRRAPLDVKIKQERKSNMVVSSVSTKSKEARQEPPAATTNADSADLDKQQKRQRRLIKNRESAQLSRMRKKVYIEDLELKLASVTNESNMLKDEVVYLQGIIKQMSDRGVALDGDDASRRQIVATNNSRAAGMCLLIVLFSFGLIFNSLGNNRHPAIVESNPGEMNVMPLQMSSGLLHAGAREAEVFEEPTNDELNQLYGFLNNEPDDVAPLRERKRTRDAADEVESERKSRHIDPDVQQDHPENQTFADFRTPIQETSVSNPLSNLVLAIPETISSIAPSVSGGANIECQKLEIHVWTGSAAPPIA